MVILETVQGMLMVSVACSFQSMYSLQKLSADTLQFQVITYFFYKNLTFTLTQFWFTFQTGFSGQRFYDDWFQSLYNVIFTALPVIMVGLFDKV